MNYSKLFLFLEKEIEPRLESIDNRLKQKQRKLRRIEKRIDEEKQYYLMKAKQEHDSEKIFPLVSLKQFIEAKPYVSIALIMVLILATTPYVMRISSLEDNLTIDAGLEYWNYSNYDVDNDGIEDMSGVIDIQVSAVFNWFVNDSYLATRWEIYNRDRKESTFVCYGFESACTFAGLSPMSRIWNETMYLFYGKHNAGLNNTISAQIIYVDYNLSSDDPYSDIYSSDWVSLNAIFRNITSAEENNLVNSSENHIPLFSEFEEIIIEKNSNISINISSYVTDEDNDTISYSIIENDNITFEIDQDKAILVPKENYTGITKIIFIANDGLNTSYSDPVIVNIIENLNNSYIEITPKLVKEKKDFKSSEDVVFKIKSAKRLNKTKRFNPTKPKQKKKWLSDEEIIDTRIYDSRNRLTSIGTEIEETDVGEFRITIIKERSFVPGLYFLEVNFSRSGEDTVIRQNFTWGVLAINTHKSIYLENETADIGIAVLDSDGAVVCDADITLEITDGKGNKQILTTPDDIEVTEYCYIYAVNERADYQTNYTVNSAGDYRINLTAVTGNGMWNIQDNFTVASSVDYDVSRTISQTRIFPQENYTMNITVIANKNYHGLINEYVPVDFEIKPQYGMIITIAGDTKILSWDVKLRKADKISLAYEYNAPDTSPEFYLLGKLSIGSWTEDRYYQIANDPTCSANTLDFPTGDMVVSVGANCLGSAASCTASINGKATYTQTLEYDSGLGFFTITDSTNGLDTDSTNPVSHVSVGTTTDSWIVDCNNIGSYDIRCVVAGDVSCTSVTRTITVTDAYPYWSNNESDLPVYYTGSSTQFNITWQDNIQVDDVYFESNYTGKAINYTMSLVSGDSTNGKYQYNAIMPAGTYYWRSWANDSFNQLNDTGMINFTILKSQSRINLTLNGTESNFTMNENASIWVNGTLLLGDNVNIEMYRQGKVMNNGTSPISNYTNFKQPGIYNVTLIYPESQNYTFSNITYFVKVNDSTPPNITLYTPYNNSFDSDGIVDFVFNITDNSSIDNCELIFSTTVVGTNTSINKDVTQVFTKSGLVETTYKWSINCTDVNGYEASSEFRNVVIDKTDPKVILDAPLNNTWDIDGIVQMKYTPNDFNLETCILYTNFSGVWKANQSNSSPVDDLQDTFNSTYVRDGNYMWNVWCNDTAGRSDWGATDNTLNESFIINIDSSNPKIRFIIPTPNNDSNISYSDLVINVTHDENNSAEIIFNLNGTNIITKQYSGNYSNNTYYSLQGEYRFNVTINDSAGNRNKTETRIVRIDTIPPRLYLESPAGTTYDNDGFVVFKYNVSDATIGVRNCSLIIDGIINWTNISILEKTSQNFSKFLNNGTYKWSINCSDGVYNTNYSEIRNITIDTTIPFTRNESVNNTLSNVQEDVCLYVIVNDTYSDIDSVKIIVDKPDTGLTDYIPLSNDSSSCAGGGWNWSISFTNDQQGEYVWNLTNVTDRAGNYNVTAPSIKVNWSAVTNYFMNTTLTWPVYNFEINESEQDRNFSFLIECNVSCQQYSSGACTNVILFPEFNNETWDDTKWFVLTNKTSQLISNYSNVTCGDIQNDGSYCSYGFNITTGLYSGNRNYSLRCNAISSNAPTTASELFVNVSVNDHPLALFNNIFNGSYIKGIKILNASASYDDQDIIRYVFEIDNNSQFSNPDLLCDTNESNCTINTIIQTKCEQDTWNCFIRINVTDSDGLKNSTILNVQIDNTNPAIRLESPSNNSWQNDYNTKFKFTSFDTNIDTCIIHNNITGIFEQNGTNTSIINNTLTSFSTHLKDGTFIWNVWCNDSAGNSAFNNTNFTVNIDTAIPKISYFGATENNDTYFARDFVYINVTTSDNNSQNLIFYLYDSTLSQLNKTNYTVFNGRNSSVNYTNLADPDEMYYYNVTIRDKAGNENSTETRVITLDNTVPEIGFDSGTAENNSYFNRDWIFINVSVNETNFANITYYLYNSSLDLVNETNFTTSVLKLNFTNLADPDEMYYYNVTIRDKVGFENYTRTRQITLDDRSPGVRIEEPLNKTLTKNSNITFNVTPTDGNLKNCSLWTNFTGIWKQNVTNSSVVDGQNTEFKPGNIFDGSYIWNVVCYDYAGNFAFNDSNYTIEIDSNPPLSFVIDRPLNNTQSQNRTPYLNWTRTIEAHFDNYTILFDTEESFSIPYIQFRIKGNITNNSFIIPVSGQLNDNTLYYWKVVAYDNLSQYTESNKTYVYITDTDKPTINLSSPSNNTLQTGSSVVEFKFNVSDENDVANCSLVVDHQIGSYDTIQNPLKGSILTISKSLQNGDHNWSINCTDKAGNTNTTETRNISLDVQIPLVTFYESYPTDGNTIYLNKSQDLTPNYNPVSCSPGVNIMITALTTEGVKNNGFLILGSQPVTFSGDFELSRTKYITWKLYHDINDAGYSLYVQDGDDSTGGTIISATRGVAVSSSQNTPAGDLYLDNDDKLRLIADLYFTGGSGGQACAHYFDNDYSYVKLYGYILGYIYTNISSPLSDITINRSKEFNVSCNVSCYDGYCINSKVYIQTRTGTERWEDVPVSDSNIILASALDSNPQTVGIINSTRTINFTLKANIISSENQLRCIAKSDYSDHNGTMIIYVNIRDATPPSLVLNSPSNGSYQSHNNITLYYTPDDNYNVSNCSLIINDNWNQSNSSIIESLQNYFKLYNLQESEYNWSINCTDNYNNSNLSDKWTFIVDITKPNIYYSGSTENNDTYFARDFVFINVTAFDTNQANLTFYLFNSSLDLINKTNYTVFNGRNSSVNYTNLADPDEMYYYNVTIRDKAGNENSTETRVITLDNTVPEIGFDSGTEHNNSYFNRDWIFINVSVNETNFADITYYLYNSSLDLVNETNFITSVFGLNFTNLADPDEMYYYNVTIRDKVGFESYTKTRVITLDNTVPEIGFDSGTAENNSYFNRDWIFINVSVNETNFANITYYLYNSSLDLVNETNFTTSVFELNFTNLADPDEIYYYNVTIRDKVGFESYTKTRVITLDNTSPVVKLDLPDNNSWYSAGNVDFYYTGFDDNIDTCVLYHNESGIFVGNETNSTVETGVQDIISINLEDGIFIWNIWCNDSAGNFAFNKTNYTINVDTTKPKIDFDVGTEHNNSYFNRDWIFINVSINETNFANITYYLYNSSLDLVNETNFTTSVFELNFTNLADPDEMYYYNVTIRDKAGNENSTETRVITLDNTVPEIGFDSGTAENNSYFNRDWIFINVSINETNFANITYYLYNSSLDLVNETNFTTSVFGLNFTNLADPDEMYYYNVTIRDKAGNENSTETRVITLDSRKPRVDFISPTPINNSNISSTSLIVNISYTDINNDSAILDFNGTKQIKKLSIGYSNFSLEDLGEGIFYYNVTLNDSAGNYNITSTRILRVDRTAPKVDLLSPYNYSWIKNSSNPALLKYSANDGLLSVSNCTLVINGIMNRTNYTVSESIANNFTEPFEAGYYNWSAICADSLNNINETDNWTIRVDLDYPKIENMSVNATSFNITTYICMNVSVTDSFSGINKTYALIKEPDGLIRNILFNDTGTGACGDEAGNNIYWAEYQLNKIGRYNWTGTIANDSAGNKNYTLTDIQFNTSSLATLTVNMTYPFNNLRINESETDRNYTYRIECRAQCNDNDGAENCTDVFMYAQYNLSGISADITKSSSSLININDSYYCGNLSENPDDNEVCAYNFTIITSLDAGSTYWSVSCRAASENIGTYNSEESVNVSVNDHPNASFRYPVNDTWLSGIEILNASYSIDDQNITRYIFEIDDNSLFTDPYLLCDTTEPNCTFNTISQIKCDEESMGCYLRLNITDNDGLKNGTVRVIGIDNTPPRIKLDNPINNSNYSVSDIQFEYTPTDVNIDTCILYHNESGSFVKNATNDSVDSGVKDYININFADGIFIWNIWCNDTEGNSVFNSTNFTLKVDTTEPGINLISPSNDTWSVENLTFSYKVIDDLSDVDNCSIIINDKVNYTDLSVIEGITQEFNIYNLTDGVYNWSINCTDELGNVNKTNKRLLKIDNTKPDIIIDFPRNLTNISSTSYYINSTVSDFGIGVNTTTFEYRASESDSWQIACIDEDDAYGYNCTWDTLGLIEGGTYQIRAIANDSLGTRSDYDIRLNITIDRTPPIVRIFEPSNNTRDLDGEVLFRYNVSDVVSAIANCSLIVDGKVNQTNYTISLNTSNNFTLRNMAEREYNWSVNCTDSAGNTNSSYFYNISVNADRTPPIINAKTPLNNSIYTRTDVIFTYNVTDSLSDIANCTIIINNTANDTDTNIEEDTTQTFTVRGFNDGNYIWQINCTDNSTGFYNTGKSDIFNLTVKETSNLYVAVGTSKDRYGLGESAKITTIVKDEFDNNIEANISTDIIYANKTNVTVPWWNTSFKYRKPINITIVNTNLSVNYTINYTLDTSLLISSGKMLPNGSDLRIAFWNNMTGNWTELDRLVFGINEQQTSIYFRTLEQINVNESDLRYYVYYGNDSVISAPDNKSNVYLFYDSFDTDTISNYETTYSFDAVGAIYEDLDSTLTHNVNGWIDYAGTNEKGKSMRLFGNHVKDAVIEAYIYNGGLALGSFFSNMQLAARIQEDNYYFFSASTNVNPSEMGRYELGNQEDISTNDTAIFTLQEYWYPMKMIIYDNSSAVNILVYVNGSKTFNYSDDDATRITEAGSIGIGGYQLIGKFDNVSVRIFSYNEPIVDTGFEEEFIERLNGSSGEDGALTLDWDTLGSLFGNYSAVSLARNEDYLNGFGSKSFEVAEDNNPPTVNLNHPVDDFNTSEDQLMFNWTVDDGGSLNLTCNLTVNNAVVIANITSIDGTDTNVTIINLSEGANFWNVTCWDRYNNTNASETKNFTVIKGPEFLNATLAEDNQSIILDWNDLSYAESYSLFIIDSFDSEFSEIANVSGIKDSNYTDSTCGNKTSRFYRIAAVKGNSNKTTTKIVGKYEFEMRYDSDLLYDWNLLSIPLNITNFMLDNGSNNGYDFNVEPLGCIRYLYFYNATIQEFKRVDYNGSAWIQAQGSENFTSLEMGRGYWAEINRTCNITFVGEVPSSNLTINLEEGWNLVGWNSVNVSYLPMASADNGWQKPEPPYYPINVNPIDSVQAIDRYNTATGRFEVTIHYGSGWGWWPSWSNQDFTYLEPHKGYYFDVSPVSIWEQKPNTNKG